MSRIQLIRSATLKIKLGNRTFLIDPMLGERSSFESYGGIQKNPIIDLPFSVDEILSDIDAILLTHLHKDHFDDAARKFITKDIPIFCQPGDLDGITNSGFINVEEIYKSKTFHGIELIRTDGNHGRGAIEKLMGNVSGFVLTHKNEPTIYVVGDCIFNETVKNAIDQYQPDIIITNSGGAFIPGYEENLILMNETETIALAEYAEKAKVISVHLEALDHCTVSRASLKRALLQSKIENERVIIPIDGEKFDFHQ